VASFFVSRVDTEVDKRLDAIGTEQAKALRGKAAIANARLAYALFEEKFGTDRFAALAEKGANKQRPLWASTGVKDPAYPDTMYVTDLVVADTVNTMPEKTLKAFAEVVEVLEQEGVQKFDASWAELVEDVQIILDEFKSGKEHHVPADDVE
jgi:transaldolase